MRKWLQDNCPDLIEIAQSHSTALETRTAFYQLGYHKQWDDAFKFTVIRNPFDWLVSNYEYIRAHSSHPQYVPVADMDFGSFVKFFFQCIWSRVANGNGTYNNIYSFIYDTSEQVLLNEVYRLEDIDKWKDQLKMDLHLEGSIRRMNKSNRKKDYRTYYTPETLNYVRQHMGYEINLLKYDF